MQHNDGHDDTMLLPDMMLDITRDMTLDITRNMTLDTYHADQLIVNRTKKLTGAQKTMRLKQSSLLNWC